MNTTTKAIIYATLAALAPLVDLLSAADATQTWPTSITFVFKGAACAYAFILALKMYYSDPTPKPPALTP